ncbi:MAG TPA: glycosyltransferase 87 family protein [Candidatus Dormibacteraeota bacterium]|nr:glycosyltransferase 87 family protein [Candidatus Dormibacteraeota bacterium]
MSLRFDRRALLLLTAAGLSLGMAVYSLHQIGPGVDFWAFYRAAREMLSGGSPYAAKEFVSAPALAVVLEPLARLPFWDAYWVFLAVTGLLGATAALFFGRELGWKHPELIAAGGFVAWVGFSSLLQGQIEALLLAVLLGSLVLMLRGRMLAAGLVLGLFWLKPDVMWPAVLFAGVALWPEWRALARYLTGLGLTSAAFVGLGAGFLPEWIHALTGLGAGAGGQPDLAGLPVLLEAAPRAWGLGTGFHSPVTWVLLAVALASLAWLAFRIATGSRWQRLPPDRRLLWAVGLSLGIWLLVTPYSHPYDDLLALPLLVIVIGRDAVWTGKWGPATALLLMAVAPIAWLWIPIGLAWVGVGALLIASISTFREEAAITPAKFGARASRQLGSAPSRQLAQPRSDPTGSPSP